MKKIFLLIVTGALLLNMELYAQNVKYTEHVLAQGETLSMLAEKYKTTVGDIMRLNGMHADTKLAIGQKIKIPASGQTVVREGETKSKPPVNMAKPVTQPVATKTASKGLVHVVQPKETMYSIGKKYGVTLEQLQKWNYKKDNSLEIGEVLAVSVDGIPAAVTKRKELAEQKAIATVPEQTPPLVAAETINVDNTASAATEPQHAKDNSVQQSKEKKPAANVKTETKPGERPATNAASDGSDNFFANSFGNNAGKSTATANGTAMIFKTASGWSERKYYVLMNEAPSGSIVKISAANGNIVYAKVLWKLDDMKENRGLQFRISEAAAAALNVESDRFPLTIQYYQ